jgi:hypothetical protein
VTNFITIKYNLVVIGTDCIGIVNAKMIVVIGTDCIDSYKSNHRLTATTAPFVIMK